MSDTKRVAVVGSGPSGLAIASNLLSHGVSVDIYESFFMPGGVLVYGIPDSRLPKSVVQREIDAMVTSKGGNIILNTKVGRDIKLQELSDKYDAVYISAGAGIPNKIGLDGEDCDRVYSGHDYMARFKVPQAYPQESLTKLKQGKHVIILGAGNVAMDAARTATEAGAKTVSIVYRRSAKEMPAREHEVNDAKSMGTQFYFLHTPKRIVNDGGVVQGVEFAKTELGESDASGRATFVEIPNSQYIMPCDTVVVCVGAGVDRELTCDTGLVLAPNGLIVVDSNSKTNLDNVYAGGDIVTGNKIVPLAMNAGRKAAKSILDRFGIPSQPMPKEMQEVMACISPSKH
ncbi:MAG: FAD-dependent oxidoreductase [Clostridiales bacterium]|jgi:glutamate synthase (NADPH/NADH) small chain|nr:FAD-dependent oxidoreductase [Clostridiales bacterium]